MAAEILGAQRVTSGLPDLTELVMRVAGAQQEPAPNRVMITLRDDVGDEFDCEVRAVQSGENLSGVLCGLRRIGEKRAVFASWDVEEVQEEGLRVPGATDLSSWIWP